jgi:hypothetical protein
MATILFTIPANRADLLSEVHSSYTVKNVIIPGEIISKLEGTSFFIFFYSNF